MIESSSVAELQSKRICRENSSTKTSNSASSCETRMAIPFLLNTEASCNIVKELTVPCSREGTSSSSTTSRSSSSSPVALKNNLDHQQNILLSCSDLLYFANTSKSRVRPGLAHSKIEETSSEVSAQSPREEIRASCCSTIRTVDEFPSPVQCDICLKTFKERGNMTKHRKSVHGLAPRTFVCDVGGCKKSFSFRDGLNRHKATVHECRRAHMCPVDGCGKRFKQRSHAEKHVRSIHKNDLVSIHLLRAQ